MIKSVLVTNHLGESIELELKAPEKSGFFIRGGIDGLNPSKANVNVSQMATGDGGIFNSSRVNSRNIVFDIGFLESPTIEHARQRCYKYFPIKKAVTLKITASNRVCYITGYVESNEIDIFSKQQGAVISIICPDPYFYSSENRLTFFSQDMPLFEFPFSNESLVTPLIELSEWVENTQATIPYTGDAAIGLTIYIHASGSVTNLRMGNSQTGELLTINDTKFAAIAGSGISADDDITISTVRGYKFAFLQRSGTLYNILNAIEKDSDWFQLDKGDNVISYAADTGVSNLRFVTVNRIAYEGV